MFELPNTGTMCLNEPRIESNIQPTKVSASPRHPSPGVLIKLADRPITSLKSGASLLSPASARFPTSPTSQISRYGSIGSLGSMKGQPTERNFSGSDVSR